MIPAKPGQYADPNKGKAEIDPTVPATPGQNNSLATLDGEWHVHPSGRMMTTDGRDSGFIQEPNGNDYPNASKFPVNVVVGAASKTVYIYDGTRVTKELPLPKFAEKEQ